MKKSNFKKYQL